MSTFTTVAKEHAGIGKKVCACCLLTFFIVTCAVSVMAAYEEPPVLRAESILQPELLKGENHSVQDQVKNDGLFNHYTVKSSYGTFKAGSTNELKILVREILAITAMKLVETDDTAIAALKQSGENTVSGVKALVNDPKATLKGAASGVGSLFNRAIGTVGRREATDAEGNRLEQLVGISKSKGTIATKYGVNVYSQNQILQEELDRLGYADFLGGLGVGIATSIVPGAGGIVLSASGTARLLNEAINTTPASELWLQNKNKLVGMGVNADTVELFLNNPSYTPALFTVLVTALDSLKGVDNHELFITIALQASNPAMAKTITKIAVMSAGYHQNIAPLASFTLLARVTMGVRKDGTRVALLPADQITWNKHIDETVTFVKSQAKGNNLELWILGSLSKKANEELQKQGWEIHTGVGPQLLPSKK